jgi:hypothetical protein
MNQYGPAGRRAHAVSHEHHQESPLGYSGVARIAVNRTLPAMQAGEWCEVAARRAARGRAEARAGSAFPKPTAPTTRCWPIRR